MTGRTGKWTRMREWAVAKERERLEGMTEEEIAAYRALQRVLRQLSTQHRTARFTTEEWAGYSLETKQRIQQVAKQVTVLVTVGGQLLGGFEAVERQIAYLNKQVG